MLNQEELRALTLWRPWPHTILYGGKPVENRPWKPWKMILGKYIVLHAGLKYDMRCVEMAKEIGEDIPPADKDCPKGCIVGVTKITGYVDRTGYDNNGKWSEEGMSSWFMGPYGWILKDVVPFVEPVPAKGSRGLWKVEGVLRDEVNKAYIKAVNVYV